MKKNNKGFTLVELLAVIVILGLLMAIAIPSVTKYITQSRVKTLISSMDSYITAVVTSVNDGEYKFSDSTKVFAIPIECVSLEKGGTNPFGNWYQANSSYWAYVLVHYDSANYNYEYGFTFKDDAGYGLYPTLNGLITNSMVKTGYDDLNQPKDGLALDFVTIDKWEGFRNISTSTELIVLEAASEGVEGDGKDTCTLQQKGDNYSEVENTKKDDLPEEELPMLRYTSGFYDKEDFWKYRNTISSITFEDTINIPADAYESWDVSSTDNGKVMAYIKKSPTNSSYYDLWIQGEGKIYANPDSSYLFGSFSNLNNIYNIDILDTSKVTNMSQMFYNSGGKTFTLDLGNNFKTNKVTNMSKMFAGCGESSTIFTLNLGTNFDTSNVVNMDSMFYKTGYKNPSFTLELGDKFDTSKVTSMDSMFRDVGYSSKTFTLDLGNKFNTSNVVNMYQMFFDTGYSSQVFTLDLGDKFDTKNVTNMSSMFRDTAYKTKVFTLDLGDKFDTSKVTNMSSMFADTGFNSTVFKLDLGDKFDTRNVTNMGFMFQQAGYSSTVFELELGDKFDTSQVTSMAMMFWYTGSANPNFRLDCSNWNVDNVSTHYNFTYNETKVKSPLWKK